jgi:ribosomal protein S14
MASLVEKAVAGFHTVRIEHELCLGLSSTAKLCMGEFHLGRHKLRACEIRLGHSELVRRSARCVRVGSARAVVRGELHPWPP